MEGYLYAKTKNDQAINFEDSSNLISNIFLHPKNLK